MRGGEHTKSFTYYLEPLTNVPSNELRAAFARMNLIPSPTAHIDGVVLPNRTVAWSRNAPSHAMVSFAVGTMLSKKLMEELELKLKHHSFWKELDEIYEKYYPRQMWLGELKKEE